MSGIQRYGALSEYGNGGDAKFFKKYNPDITWGERIFYRRDMNATKVYELINFPQELKEYVAVAGKIETTDTHSYVDVGLGFLLFNNDIYRFGTYEEQAGIEVFVPSNTLTKDDTTDLNTLDTYASNVFQARKSDIWYWKGDKYIYTLDFDCINTTPITTSTDEPIGGALAKSQTVVLKTQFFNDYDDDYIPNRFDIIEWRGDLYVVDEQDTIPQYRPALVNYYLISMTKLL